MYFDMYLLWLCVCVVCSVVWFGVLVLVIVNFLYFKLYVDDIVIWGFVCVYVWFKKNVMYVVLVFGFFVEIVYLVRFFVSKWVVVVMLVVVVWI